jgi:citrate lyase subunit beta/citryl-CoA lyase
MAPFEAGRRGETVRSDCFVAFTPAETGGIEVQARSKVESMYGDAIRRDAAAALERLGVRHGRLEIEDNGALPFVLLARIEGAVRRAGIPRRLLPAVASGARRPGPRERFRRSRLYLPGMEPKFMLNAGLHEPDGVILDLEDSVAPAEKDTARILVRNALRVLDFRGAERMVRINQLPLGLTDLEELVPQNMHLVLIPKCESAEQVRACAAKIEEVQGQANYRPEPGNPDGSIAPDRHEGCGRPFPGGFVPEGETRPQPVWLMPILESALGILRAYEIATAHPTVVALTIGLEDYTADLGTQRTLEGRESFFARSMVVNAAKAAGLQAIDTVFSDVADMEGLRQSVLEARGLGFEGKGCIHPRQIEVVHRAFAPDPAELDRARRIVEAFRAAEARGEAVVSLGSKMIDPPVVKRALRVVRLAEMLGLVGSGESAAARVEVR